MRHRILKIVLVGASVVFLLLSQVKLLSKTSVDHFVESISTLSVTNKVYSRVWVKRPYKDWCHTDGLTLIKVPKSASSTVTGMALRIQHQHNCSHISWEHGTAREKELKHSFVIAPIRLPHARALSSVYFHYVSFHSKIKRNSDNSKVPSDNFLQNKLDETPRNFILQYTTPIVDAGTDANATDDYIRSVLDRYDFLMVVERLPESLAILSWITDLPITDLLTVNSKTAGSWYLVQPKGRNNNTTKQPTCISLVAPVLTPGIQHYFYQDSWQQRHAGDYELYEAATLSLNRTIQAIGVDWVTAKVAELQAWQNEITAQCVSQAQFPCNASGHPQLELSQQSCYLRDFGCGYHCIDEVVAHATTNVDCRANDNCGVHLNETNETFRVDPVD